MTDDLPPRPKPLPVNFELAPTDLCDLNQWVLWRYEWEEGKDGKPGKWDKPPYTSQGRHASATNPGTWISFKEAKTAYQRGQELPADNKKHFDGIGFVPTKDVSTELHPTLIDLDKCRDPDTGEIEAWAKEELDLINSYSEVSPSATGIRIVTRARALPEDGKGRKKGPVEIYQTAHYLTITGHRLEQFPRTVEERVDEVDCFYRRHFHETNGKGKKPGDQRSSERTNLTDDDIITLATKAANGDKFMRLMDGDISGYKSESEADEALCCIIAFYTRDEAQIEQIWGQSGLARRDKFQREDYRQRTIENALKTVKEQYKGTGFEAKKRKNKGNAKRSIATRLVELAKESGSELWHTPDGEPFISFTIEDHRENYPLRNKAVRRWLGKLIYEAEGKAANAQALQDATNILEAEAVYKGHEYDVHVRVGEYGDAIYIDLCDNKWRAIEINASGWKITEHPPIRFMRSKGMLALPDPVGGGSLEDLKHLLNINDERTWILIKAILVGALLPSAPCPVVIFGGEQGSSKSTTQRIIKDLIDPNEAPLRLPPKDERDLMIAAKNSWIVSFDNLSGIRNDLSDALCVLCTGGAFSTRELYTDTEETLLSVRRPVFLNGIDSIPSRHDLLDRAIIIILPRMKEGQRRTEKEIMAEFDRIRPGVLGALCSAVSIGLKNLPTTIIQNMPRMADFAIWVTACEPGLGLKPGSFMKAYKGALNDAVLDTISSDSLAQTIIDIAKQEKNGWSGTATQLLSKINRMNGYNYQRPPMGWPQTASGLSSKLNRLTPALRKVGIDIRFDRKSQSRLITICKLNDGMTAHDGEVIKGRHNENQVQETLSMVESGHNDGDDGDFFPLACEEREEERGDEGEGILEARVGEKERHDRHGVISDADDSDSHVTAHSEVSVIHDCKSVMPKLEDTCPVCGEDIGPGHSSRTFERVSYCTSCPPHLSMIRATVGDLTEKNGAEPTISEIYQDIKSKVRRAPREGLLPAMLRSSGCVEKDGRWGAPQNSTGCSLGNTESLPSHPSLDSESGCHKAVTKLSSYLVGNEEEPKIGPNPRKNLPTPVANQKSHILGEEVASNGDRQYSDTALSHEDGSIEDVLKEAERIEANGGQIVPSVLADNLGLELSLVCKSLTKLGYTQLKETDPATHMCIWAKTGNESNTYDPAKAEAL